MKIANVSYVNSIPFRYGLQKNFKGELVQLVPSAIANGLEHDDIDVGLVPVAAYLGNQSWQIVSEYCIGAVGPVKTVLVVSKKPIHQVRSICYDSDSRSSNMLTKVLSAYYWQISPEEVEVQNAEARVIIGDKAFLDYPEYEYVYDLSAEWFAFQQLPFVFAVWVSNKVLSEEAVENLNVCFKYGLDHLGEAVDCYRQELPVSVAEASEYLVSNISFTLDEKKKEAIQRFADLASKLNLI